MRSAVGVRTKRDYTPMSGNKDTCTACAECVDNMREPSWIRNSPPPPQIPLPSLSHSRWEPGHGQWWQGSPHLHRRGLSDFLSKHPPPPPIPGTGMLAPLRCMCTTLQSQKAVHLLTCKVSIYCLLTLHGSAPMMCIRRALYSISHQTNQSSEAILLSHRSR